MKVWRVWDCGSAGRRPASTVAGGDHVKTSTSPTAATLQKYDLCLELLGGLRLRRFVFAAMLTPDDRSRDGGFTDFPCGERDPDLYQFLRDCLADGRREVGRLSQFCSDGRFAWGDEPLLEPRLEGQADIEPWTWRRCFTGRWTTPPSGPTPTTA